VWLLHAGIIVPKTAASSSASPSQSAEAADIPVGETEEVGSSTLLPPIAAADVIVQDVAASSSSNDDGADGEESLPVSDIDAAVDDNSNTASGENRIRLKFH